MAPFDASSKCCEQYLKFHNVEPDCKKDFDGDDFFERKPSGKLIKLGEEYDVVTSDTVIVTLPRKQIYENYGHFLESLGYKYSKKWNAYGYTCNPNGLWTSYFYGRRLYILKGSHIPVSSPIVYSKIFLRTSSILKVKQIDWNQQEKVKKAEMINCWKDICSCNLYGHKTISQYSALRKYGFVENEKIGAEYLEIEEEKDFVEKYGYRFKIFTDAVINAGSLPIFKCKENKEEWINNFKNNHIDISDPNTTLIFLNVADGGAIYLPHDENTTIKKKS